jgi:hypothetical protein
MVNLYYLARVQTNLQAINRQPPARFVCAILKVGNHGMVHILLLLSQELCAHRIQRITPQFVVSLHNLKDIELQPPVYHSLLRVPGAVCFRREMGVSNNGFATYMQKSE